ncbi:MAG TPA: DUF3300 domain-containing protein [Chthoniobacterales bacterium]|nr:DUF3300 domain-containing protein [Chthoniobacterales bacterium]
MKPKAARPGFVIQSSHAIVALSCVALLLSGNAALLAQTPPATQPATQPAAPPAEAPDAPKIPNDQLDSLVAPIALYSDPLLAQTLAASTYPLEVIQLKQWMDQNKSLKGKALTDAVAKQPWDPSIQSMTMVPDVVTRLAGNIQWTTDLGNAFLAQQQDVMDAVQRMRNKAQSKGTLKTSKEQVVQSKSEGGKEVIVIEQASPETVYVPSYDPAIVYGPPVYPYYPYSYPGYYPGMGLAWGTGILIGAGIANGWWGNCNWGGGDININNNNNFNRNSNRNTINNRPANANGKWQHNSNHRGPAPYSNRKTADKFGGNDRGGPNSNRGPGGDRNGPGGDRNKGPGGDRNRPSNQPSNRPGGDRTAGNKPGGDRSSANRPGGDRSSANRPSNTSRPSGGGDRISNNRSTHSPSPRSNSSFGNSGGFSRSSASSSFSRGSHSMGGSRGGGMSRGGGGGGRGGGRRR